jgi:mannose-6-phosphate isomerase-like protein (cupin superfamily)
MSEQPADRIKALAAGEGPAWWFLGTLVHVRASKADTHGAFTLIEQLAPPGFGPPLHVHHVEDEVFYVLEGRVRFQCNGRDIFVETGGHVFLPKGLSHAFRIEGDRSARLLQPDDACRFRGIRCGGRPSGTEKRAATSRVPAAGSAGARRHTRREIRLHHRRARRSGPREVGLREETDPDRI